MVHGYLCWRLGDLAGATAALERALSLEPGNALAHCLMGQVLVDDRKTDQGSAHWRRALQIDPRSRWASAGLRRLAADPGRTG